ncbi:MAG: fumarylacetoacetate hydrolase family protein [Acidobacteria bacterium]|jgi:2-dehydro-3-deoxy-D-arabinonate dehydratase|nr:fumarylacetoacetate hydrolase family protein [Bryobacteraceae bacterium CoA2 C42]
MKLGQIKWNNEVTAAVFDGDKARPIPGHTLYDLIRRSEVEKTPLTELASTMAATHKETAAPIIPLSPKEVWACGCTYEMSASFRDAEHNTREGFYRYVFDPANRPEVFFKGTSRVCVGPNAGIGLRADSKFTAPEPELAVVLGSNGRIVGYTISNDVSAWDIEKENPLYLPQSKQYAACCSLGPVMVTADELTDPYKIDMTCTIKRGETQTFYGETSTGKLGRKIETLIEYLLRSNPVPCGSVLLTGTGIIVTQESALAAGDVVTITASGIGELSNPCVIV